MIKYRGILFFLTGCLSSCVYHEISPEEIPVEPVCDSTTVVSWQSDILPIMVNSCATEKCHDGITRRDWTNYDEVKKYAVSIKKRTQDKSMPFDGPLPQDQIDLIACWVNNGAENN
jgi:hypothetical protein